MTEAVHCNSRRDAWRSDWPRSNVSPKAFWSAALCRNRSGKALVKMPAGKTSGQDSAAVRNLLAKLDPLSRGHPQQIGDTPDDMVLEVIQSTLADTNLP